MKIEFFKYQGTGNDFIMIDDRYRSFPDQDTALITALCDRRFGVGSDGLILIRKHDDLDFEMVYFNADGSQSLCGNGSRCAVNFAKYLGMISKQTDYLTIDGNYHAEIDDSGIVHIHMRDISGLARKGSDYFLNNGSPHHIIFGEDNSDTDVHSIGKSIRESEEYQPGGTNVNFVQILGENSIDVRTYERGVENETLSCGTGVTASSLAASENGVSSPIRIKTKGGELYVRFDKADDGKFENIWLSGPAELVFSGTVEV